MQIKGLIVSTLSIMNHHMANGSDKLHGNVSGIKKRPDGRVYISGQMQRHATFAAMDRINKDPACYVSNGDGINTDIARDLRGDLGGFMDPTKGMRRTGPLSVTPAVARKGSDVSLDLLARMQVIMNGKTDDAQTPEEKAEKDESKTQMIAHREYSQFDEMVSNFHLDIPMIGAKPVPSYVNKVHMGTTYEYVITNAEILRRIILLMESTRFLNDYANCSRNATCAEPQQVIIALDESYSRKLIRYFNPEVTPIERERMLLEVKARDGLIFIGDDTDAAALSVLEAYTQAIAALKDPRNTIGKK